MSSDGPVDPALEPHLEAARWDVDDEPDAFAEFDDEPTYEKWRRGQTWR
jgi:hypothetical protein